MKRFITSNPFLYTLGLAFVFLLWTLISFSEGAGNLIFPSPIDTFSHLFGLLGDSYIYECILSSLWKTLQGFGIAFLLAVLLGSISGTIKPLQSFFKPTMLVLKSVPTAAFVFLFLVKFGTSQAPIWIVGMLAFPILYESVVAGINAVPKEIIYAARVDQASFASSLFKIKIPLAFPYILLGVLSSFALSFKTEIMAELITGQTSPGLGGAIRVYRIGEPADLTGVFAIALIALLIVLIVDLFAFAGKKLIH